MKSFFDYTRPEVARYLGRPARATRLYKAVYQDRIGSLSTSDRPAMEHFDLALPPVVNRFESADGTRRYLLRLQDGEVVESVLIPENQRFTFCISSQIGCALACKFCLTGQLGLVRNLSAAEIVSQALVLRAGISGEHSDRFSVVLMGMGEPLQNYENVLKAIQILVDDHGVALPLRRITLSTAGLLPGIERLAKEPLFPNLSISLSGTTNETRDELMPINRKYPIEDVIGVVRRLPVSRRKRVMFEYVMIKGVTDSSHDARHLLLLLRDLGAKVNLIPLNESPDIGFQRSDRSDILRFQQVLLRSGIPTFIRKTRGDDVYGACGQLRKNGYTLDGADSHNLQPQH
jgi:23S rRNA (adenine2503-C2)-methyltransferase